MRYGIRPIQPDAVSPGIHAALVVDGAGWHVSAKLVVPDNISLVKLPPHAPEFDPIENVWAYLRGTKLAYRLPALPPQGPEVHLNRGQLRTTHDSATGSPDGYVGGLRDITDRHPAEAAVRASEAFRRGVIDASPDYVEVLTSTGRCRS